MLEAFIVILTGLVFFLVVKRDTDLDDVYKSIAEIIDDTEMLLEFEDDVIKLLDIDKSCLSDGKIIALVQYVCCVSNALGYFYKNTFAKRYDNKKLMVKIVRYLDPKYRIYSQLREKYIYNHSVILVDSVMHGFVKELYDCIENYQFDINKLNTIAICEHGYYSFVVGGNLYSSKEGAHFKCGTCTEIKRSVKMIWF